VLSLSDIVGDANASEGRDQPFIASEEASKLLIEPVVLCGFIAPPPFPVSIRLRLDRLDDRRPVLPQHAPQRLFRREPLLAAFLCGHHAVMGDPHFLVGFRCDHLSFHSPHIQPTNQPMAKAAKQAIAIVGNQSGN
jgi:hypothetical protein